MQPIISLTMAVMDGDWGTGDGGLSLHSSPSPLHQEPPDAFSFPPELCFHLSPLLPALLLSLLN